MYKGRFVVIGCRKALFTRKTLFHLSAVNQDEFWIPLRRKENKNSGIRFRPLRQVAIIDM